LVAIKISDTLEIPTLYHNKGVYHFLLGNYEIAAKQRTELAALNQLKSKMFSLISHDLKGMIIPYRRVGKIFKFHIDQKNYQKATELSEELEKKSEQLSHFLENLLEQMDGYQLRMETIDVERELFEIQELFIQQVDFKNVRIKIGDGCKTTISFDRQAFHVIFRNLISNALKFTQNGSIQLNINRFNTKYQLIISDTGTGMSETQLGQLFK
jgi:signal transduction histidine kinase